MDANHPLTDRSGSILFFLHKPINLPNYREGTYINVKINVLRNFRTTKLSNKTRCHRKQYCEREYVRV